MAGTAQAEKCPAQIVGKIGFYLSLGGPVACDQRMKPAVRPFAECLYETPQGRRLGAISHHRRSEEPGNVGAQIILSSERGSVSSCFGWVRVCQRIDERCGKMQTGVFPSQCFQTRHIFGFHHYDPVRLSDCRGNAFISDRPRPSFLLGGHG